MANLTPVEQAAKKAEEDKKKSKYFDVFDLKGNLINIYEDKATAEAVAAKQEGRTVKPSPAERTREDVRDAALKLKAARKEKLEQSNPGHYTP